MLIRPLLNLPTGGHGHVICMGNQWGVFSYEQVNGRNGDHELRTITNAFILCNLL